MFRPTKARSAIFEMLSHAKYPVSADEIQKQVAADPVTVYRILDLFVNKQIAKRLEMGEGKFRYELANRAHHHHAICTNCGAMQDVDHITETDLDTVAAKKTKYTITSHALEFFGLCPRCQADQ